MTSTCKKIHKQIIIIVILNNNNSRSYDWKVTAEEGDWQGKELGVNPSAGHYRN